MEKSESLIELATSLALAQKSMKGAHKDSSNPFFKSKYADLESVWDACRDALTNNGLSILQPVSNNGDLVTVTTVLLHESGEFVSSSLSGKPEKPGAQATVSLITYFRRVGLASMVGVVATDDDGEAAQGREDSESKKKLDFKPKEPVKFGYDNHSKETEMIASSYIKDYEPKIGKYSKPAIPLSQLTKNQLMEHEREIKSAKQLTGENVAKAKELVEQLEFEIAFRDANGKL